jgi:hypothetical protein
MMSQRVTWTEVPVREPVTVINAFTVPLHITPRAGVYQVAIDVHPGDTP